MNKNKHPRAKKRLRKIDRASFPRRLLEMLVCAVVSALVVEAFNQGSIPRMWTYLTQRTLYFGINCLLILTTLSLSELVRRRRATLIALSALWMVLGVANHLVIRNRTLPLAGGDLLLDYQTVMLGMKYFSWLQIIGVFLAAVALIAVIAHLFTHTALRRRVNYAFGLCVVAMMVFLSFSTQLMCAKAGLMSSDFSDRVTSYKEYGFTTCFTLTFGQQGVEKPDDYSTEIVEEILTEVEETDIAQPQPTAVPRAMRFTAEEMENPNIVFLQLESFFDLQTMLDTELTGDPTPNFHELLEKWPSGMLHVPTVGGGTANVEFEVMSGFNMDLFGAGETPYNTIIQEAACETIAHTLRQRGYTSTALHNNTGTFFSRNQVYSNLGYDRFNSLEYMLGPKYNENGWAKDDVLVEEILCSMESTQSRDLIFTIGVESHGKYGDTYEYESGDILVANAPADVELAFLQNYVNIIRPVDTFLADLLAAFDAYDEPIVAVIYGDHLPGIGLTSEMLSTGDLYASKYIIWNNYGAQFEAPDMQAYRLSAELMRQLGFSDGVMMRFHQGYPITESGEEYMEKLQVLQYDMLYGDQEIYSGSTAPAATQLQMGVRPIRITSAIIEYGRLMVTGENFTEYSKLAVGEEILDTLFIDQNHIAALAEDEILQKAETIAVAQINLDGMELSRTGEAPIEIKNAVK